MKKGQKRKCKDCAAKLNGIKGWLHCKQNAPEYISKILQLDNSNFITLADTEFRIFNALKEKWIIPKSLLDIDGYIRSFCVDGNKPHLYVITARNNKVTIFQYKYINYSTTSSSCFSCRSIN